MRELDAPLPRSHPTQHQKETKIMTLRKAISDAIEAAQEETELEHLVEVLGDDRAQHAAEQHDIPELVYELNEKRAA